jgi:glycosyltransferase involved in cell wall biosynthesis
LNAADYFIFTAFKEPFGIAPLEAKAAGCKVIPQELPYPLLNWKEHAQKVAALYQNIKS